MLFDVQILMRRSIYGLNIFQMSEAKKKKEEKAEDLSIEDKELKETIDHHSQRLISGDLASLKKLMSLVKSATQTMTSVPKPFKFLKTHYALFTQHFTSVPDGLEKKEYAEFLSVLSMIFGEKEARTSLFYLLKTQETEFVSWGHEYMSNLANDIGKEYELRMGNNEPYDELLRLVDIIVPYFVKNNAQHDAIDLLLIVDKLEDIKQFVVQSNFSKVYSYLAAVCNYSTGQEEQIKQLLFDLSLKLEEYTLAMRIAIKLDDHAKVRLLFSECPDELIKKQLAFIAARQKIFIPDLQGQLNTIISNSLLSKFYLELAKDLEVQAPKHPRDIFKVHLEENFKGDVNAVSLFSIYVNAFVNAGLTRDAYIIEPEDKQHNNFIMKLENKAWQIATVASIGLISPWDPQTITQLLMPYIDNEGAYIKAGACIGIGLCSAGINDENDLAFALLSNNVTDKTQAVRECSILGLGLSYAGRSKNEVLELLVPIVVDNSLPLSESAFAALSLGLSFVGQCNDEAACAIMQTMTERSEAELSNPLSKYFGLALALLYMGQQEKSETILETIGVIEHPIKKFIEIMMMALAYVDNGNVLKVQSLIQECLSNEKGSETAIIGLALIASSQEIGNEMAMRLLNHILHFGTAEKKRVVPIALALLSISNPKIGVMDILFKLAYDSDVEVAQRAIVCLGLVGAGTNNSRLADILRKLASYYTKESNMVFCIRIAQGLLYMGKGMLSVQPYYSQRFLLSKVGMAGLVTFLVALLDLNLTLFGDYHYFVYFLSLAMYPKFLYVLNDKLEPMTINVRVGQAVDVVGQAGKPKKITGFQTHTAPVLISHGERAELATEEYIPIQECVLQNFVILRKNPDYVEDERPRKKTSI